MAIDIEDLIAWLKEIKRAKALEDSNGF